MGSSSKPTVKQDSTVKLGPEQQNVFGLAMPHIQQYAESTPELFGGTGIAGFSPEEQAAQNYFLQTAAPTGGALAGQAGATQAQLLDPEFMLNPNQYLTGAADTVTEKVTRNLMENILPGVRSGSTTAGGMYSGGSSREGIATGKAIGDTNAGLSDTLARMYQTNYNTGLQGMQNAVNTNQQVMSQQLFPGNIQAAVGGQKRALEQAQLDETIRNFYTSQDLPLMQSQQLLSLIGQMPGSVGQTTFTGAMPKANPLLQLAGAAATGIGYGMGGPIGGAAAGAATNAATTGK